MSVSDSAQDQYEYVACSPTHSRRPTSAPVIGRLIGRYIRADRRNRQFLASHLTALGPLEMSRLKLRLTMLLVREGDLPGANVTRAGDQNVSAKLIKRRAAATAAAWSWEKLSLTSLG